MPSKLIYIDETRELYQALKYFCEDYKIELLQFANVDETLKGTKNLLKDSVAVLLDLDFPDEQEPNLKHLVRIKASFPFVPVIVISAKGFHYQKNFRNELLRHGASLLIDRTQINPEEIVKLVHQTVQSNKQELSSPQLGSDEQEQPEQFNILISSIGKKSDKSFTAVFGFMLSALALPRTPEEREFCSKRSREYYHNIIDVLNYAPYRLFSMHLRLQNKTSATALNSPVSVAVYFTAEYPNSDYLLKVANSLANDLKHCFTNGSDEMPDVFSFDGIDDLTDLREFTGFKQEHFHWLAMPENFSMQNTQTASLPIVKNVWHDPDMIFKILSESSHFLSIDICLQHFNLLPDELNALSEYATADAKTDTEKYLRSLSTELLQEGKHARCVSMVLSSERNLPLASMKAAIKYALFNERPCHFILREAAHLNRFRISEEADTVLPFVYSRSQLSMVFWWPLPAFQIVKGMQRLPFNFTYYPVSLPKQGILLGNKRTLYRHVPVRISESDLSLHLYIIGQTGTGKSTMLKTLFSQLAEKGEGICLIDPHGDLADAAVQLVSNNRKKDVVLFDIGSKDCPAMNLMEYDTRYPEQKEVLIEELFFFMQQNYDMRVVGGSSFETYFRNCIEALDDEGTRTWLGIPVLSDIPRFFYEKDFRDKILRELKNHELKNFWQNALQATGDQAFQNWGTYVAGKINKLVGNEVLRPIISARKPSAINFPSLIDESKILIVKLDKGKVGSTNVGLMGFFILNRIVMTAMSQGGLPYEKRKRFTLIVDEFQNFTSPTLGMALSEVRKYKLQMALANQTISQLNEQVAAGVLGNVGSRINFRLSPRDAEQLAPMLSDTFSKNEIVSLPNYHCIGHLLNNGVLCKPFVFQTVV